jgi:CheY-like chemotaxis protein
MPPRARAPVLIVDDDEAIRDSLRAVLEDEGYQVVEAPDGLIALEVLHALPSQAIVLTNHNMPRLDGPGLVNMIVDDATLANRCAVIYMTAGNRILPPVFTEQLRELHAPVLRKPFDLDVLFEAIEAGTSRMAHASDTAGTPATSATRPDDPTSRVDTPGTHPS